MALGAVVADAAGVDSATLVACEYAEVVHNENKEPTRASLVVGWNMLDVVV